jgi:hypothetical protein
VNRAIKTAMILVVLAAAALPLSAGEPSYGFKFSGFFKTDAMWDNTRLYPGDYRLWVQPYDEKNNEFFLTANETRLGFDFWWDETTYTTKAKLEFDFYGAAPAENKSQPMLRHAYVSLAGGSWMLLFGQTWDIIAPLNPKTVNYSVNWGQGNIGYRRPQIRFAYKFYQGEKTAVKLDVGISRNIGSDVDGDGFDDGADAAIPTFQGRLGLGTSMGSEGKLAIGVSSHYGLEKYADTTSAELDAKDTPSWSINGDLMIKVNEYVALMGEFFMGENLKQYLGGVLQGVNPLGDPLPATGGWGLVQINPSESATFNFGYSWDNPDEAEWKVPDNGKSYTLRDLNTEAYGNLMYKLTGNVTLMFELAWLETKYRTSTYGMQSTTEKFDALRFQFAVKAGIM